jgi:hypothetical protein
MLREAGWHREFHRPHSGFPPWLPRENRDEILADAEHSSTPASWAAFFKNDAIGEIIEQA